MRAEPVDVYSTYTPETTKDRGCQRPDNSQKCYFVEKHSECELRCDEVLSENGDSETRALASVRAAVGQFVLPSSHFDPFSVLVN